MNIQNKTDITTASLRKFCLAGLKHEGMAPDDYVIQFTYARKNSRMLGWGSYNRKWIRMNVDRNHNFDMKRLAQVFSHEIGHNRGLHHKDMPKSVTLDVPWVEGLKFDVAMPCDKVRVNVREKRYLKAKRQLECYQKKLKRIEKLVKKYEGKVKYYERSK